MKFGLFYLPTYIPAAKDAATHFDNIIEQVVFADKVGIDYAWMVEHHFVTHGGLCASNYSLLSYLAAKTSRIRLGSGATVMPLNDPIRVAEQGATLDQLSKGRFDLGVGRGFIRDEFDAFGVPMAESRDRVEEGITLVKQAWSGERLTLKPAYRPPIDDLQVLPPLYSKKPPPIWNACFLSPESFEWTADQGYNLLYVAYHVDSKTAEERIHWYLDALPKYGRRAEDVEVCTAYHAHFVDSADPAHLASIVEQPMSEYTRAGVVAARKPPDPTAYKGYTAREDYQRQSNFNLYYPDRVLMGNRDQALARITHMRKMGITQIAMLVDFGSLQQTAIMKSLEIFARDILPEARKI